MKFFPKDSNPNSYSLYPTSTYICEVTTILRVHDGLTCITNV